jgi:uroporphyrin-III C-methyltransferase
MTSRMSAFGLVQLVGAGPGDPELLTLKAARAIGQADVVLVDDLVHEEVLVHARADARIVRVGKRGGCASTPQAFIERLMVQEARAGQRVVRLKGGDPMVFGRAGEEIEALQAEGITVEVISGISAGISAASSVQASLTHREHAHGVLVTGHAKPGDDGMDWPALARSAAQAKLSLVVYMGISGVDTIANGLLEGLDAHTPAVVVQNASAPNERRHATTLGQLARDVRAHALASPSVLLIGPAFATAKPQCAEHPLSMAIAA